MADDKQKACKIPNSNDVGVMLGNLSEPESQAFLKAALGLGEMPKFATGDLKTCTDVQQSAEGFIRTVSQTSPAKPASAPKR